jgi:PAS domain S-box-containing protein
MHSDDDWELTALLEYEPGQGDPFAAAMRGTHMPMVITDTKQPDHLLVFANDAFLSMTGYRRDELTGRDCRLLQGPLSDTVAVKKISVALSAGRPVDVDMVNYRKDGSTFWNDIRIAPVHDAGGKIRFWVASMLDVTERVDSKQRLSEQNAIVEELVGRRTVELQSALAARTTLLHELDHRVKNNLAMIGSLVRLQARAVTEPVSRLMFEDLLTRIDALSTVHRRLFYTEDGAQFDLAEFAQTLVADVLAGAGRDDIAVDVRTEPANIGSANAAAVGLILNELITNAVKHAFADQRSGRLTLHIRSLGDRAEITLEDDGPGFDVMSQPAESLGRLLIERLSRQISAVTSWESDQSGTRVRIELPINA